jgi:hypothetical protein
LAVPLCRSLLQCGSEKGLEGRHQCASQKAGPKVPERVHVENLIPGVVSYNSHFRLLRYDHFEMTSHNILELKS